MAERSRWAYWKCLGTVVGALTGLALAAIFLLTKEADYGMAVFILMPMAVGFVTSTIISIGGRTSFASMFGYSSFAMGLCGLAFVTAGGEGLLCLAMALPVILIPVLLGCAIGYAITYKKEKSKNKDKDKFIPVLILLAVLPPSALDELASRDRATVATYSSSVTIAASPDAVWHEVEHLGALPPAHDWMSKLGLACPESTELKGHGIGAERDCALSTGPMKETITTWIPGRALGFDALNTPPPMKEMNPFGEPHPAHLGQRYFRIHSGEFLIEPVGNGLTRLTRTTVYEHRLRPAAYWTFWCNFAADYAHSRVLNFIKIKAESRSAATIAQR